MKKNQEKKCKDRKCKDKKSFNIVKLSKFLLFLIINNLFLATIDVNLISKVSEYRSNWEPTAQKCISLVNSDSSKKGDEEI